MSHTTYSFGNSTYSSQSMEPTFHTNSMEAARIVAVEILEAPEVDSLPGVRVKESKHFFTKDVAPRWASNLRPLHGNYGDE